LKKIKDVKTMVKEGGNFKSQAKTPKQKENELIASELDSYAFRMDEQSLIVQSKGSLYGSDLVFLRNSKVGDSSLLFRKFY